ncbi:MAG: Holliday junction resolvase RuvX [Cyclobacteriaceae bacterium]|nr:Holliday junction resolvase RuvX [Cyclobacteriaceae bacterium]
MSRLLAIDYGLKRVGIAVTDPLQIIATALETVPAKQLINFLISYCKKEEVEAFIVGKPLDLNLQKTDSTDAVYKFVKLLKKTFPKHTVHLHDERFTSKMALDAMIRGGSTKKDRRKKENIDKVSATIILQSFMESQLYNK